MMTLAKRVIACLDVQGGRVMKGTNFVSLREVGDPVALATAYEAGGADEIVFLDISATSDERAALLDAAQATAEQLFIPLTIGGGIRSADDARRALRAGADKISINSAGVSEPRIYEECADRFGRQCVVASIDAKRTRNGWEVYVSGGRTPTGLDAVAWASKVTSFGAGELLLTSIDRDGTRNGYDVELTSLVVREVDVPVVASGGAGSTRDVVQVFHEAHADAALVAGILHDGTTTIRAIKDAMRNAGIDTRVPA